MHGEKLEQSEGKGRPPGLEDGAGRRGELGGRFGLEAPRFILLCVPPDNETEPNDISIFSVFVLSLLRLPLKKNKKNKKDISIAPYRNWSHKAFFQDRGIKWQVGR